MRNSLRLAFLTIVLVGCSGPQSTFDPAGPAADSINRLGLVMWIGAAFGLAIVTVAMLLPFMGFGRGVSRRTFLWGGGVGLPTVSLIGLLIYSGGIGEEMRRPQTALSIEATGRRFWWEFRYERPGLPPVVTANELRLPVGEPVEVRLRSEDVIHSFWVPSLAGKTDMIPGRHNRMTIEASRPGVYRGQCAEFCGQQHALMAFPTLAMPRAEFDAWLARENAPAPAPETPFLEEGRRVYVSSGCGSCHSLRGVSEGLRNAPDLTHVGARRSLAAGTLPGGVGNLAAWISSSQHLKPANSMPSYDRLDGRSLHALAAYLDSLK